MRRILRLILALCLTLLGTGVFAKALDPSSSDNRLQVTAISPSEGPASPAVFNLGLPTNLDLPLFEVGLVVVPHDNAPSFEFRPVVILSAERSLAGDFLSGGVSLYYYNARFYDPTLGRFLNEDPARQGSDWYVYCADNPLRWTDPSGLLFGWDNVVAAGVGLVVGVTTEVAIQAGENVASGKGAFDNLNWGDVAVSAGVGLVTGATETGLIAQGKKAAEAFKVLNKAGAALKERQAAMAAGKVRNAVETAKKAETVQKAKDAMTQAGLTVAGVAAAKKVIKAVVNQTAPKPAPTTQPSTATIKEP